METLERLDEEAYHVLVKNAFKILAEEETEDVLSASDHLIRLDPFVLKQAFAALTSFIVEAAKTDGDSATIGAQLEELGIEATRVELLSKCFAAYKDRVRERLAHTGISFGAVVGFDWRLDYNVRSGDAGKENNPSYLITLQVRGVDGVVSPMHFSCTPEQLQELEATVRDATQQVGRLLGKS